MRRRHPRPPSLPRIGCLADFERLASPLDATVPGARALKTVIDRFDADALYFQNTHLYGIHHAFASAHLSGGALPIVPQLAEFNATEYSSPSRRFLLGTVTWYQDADIFAYEIAPYDQSSADMIAAGFRRVAESAYFADRLYFHPSSQAVEAVAAALPQDIPVITTDELFAEVAYQPLNVAEGYGRLRFVTAAELETEYVSFRDIVVLDAVPNDISVVSGIITEAFQTPLSHINVLSKNRGTPNMALRGAWADPTLRALEGQWVRLEVTPLEYTIEPVEQAIADAWWEAHKPSEVQIPGARLDVRDLRDIEDTVEMDAPDLRDAIKAATRAFGGKAAHYGVLIHVEGVPSPPAFAIPVVYYFEHLTRNGLDAAIDRMLADPDFNDDPAVRDAWLEDLRAAIERAPVDPELLAALELKLAEDFPDTRMRYRSSTNAEDLDGFTGAGLYTSESAGPDDIEETADTLREVWASVWSLRAFEERSYRSIDHKAVGMAMLVHRSFPDEDANGVALTDNPFDQSGLEPAFFINVQLGETSVVQPPAGVTTESFLYYYDRADQPITFISRSSLVPQGTTVLTAAQTRALGQALARIRAFFTPVYAPRAGDAYDWWAMDVEFKFDTPPGGEPTLYIKQARPYR
ncbi:MAG: PEP/pyruvate-binding domain-containing protein [bacterium]